MSTTIELPEIRSSSANSFFYHGDREGWHIALSVHRDSDALDRSNWEIITASVLAIPDDRYCRCGHLEAAHVPEFMCNPRIGVSCTCRAFVETRSNMALDDLADAAIERMGHFGYGWVDYLLVRPGSSAERKALEWREKLDNYPVADEDHYSQLEWDEEWCLRCGRATREQHTADYRCQKFRGEYEKEEILRRWDKRGTVTRTEIPAWMRDPLSMPMWDDGRP